jgi:hypothetical protein
MQMGDLATPMPATLRTSAEQVQHKLCCLGCATQWLAIGPGMNLFAAGKVMVLEALLKSIRSSEPTDKVVLVSNYTGGSCTDGV